MNPTEARELIDLFGPDALERIRDPERLAEAVARRLGGPIPDMRAGAGKAVPISPSEAGRILGGSRPTAGAYQEPVSRTVKKTIVAVRGRKMTIDTALTWEQYDDEMARLESANEEALAAARRAKSDVPTGLRVEIPTGTTGQRRLTAGQVRTYAALSGMLRQRPRGPGPTFGAVFDFRDNDDELMTPEQRIEVEDWERIGRRWWAEYQAQVGIPRPRSRSGSGQWVGVDEHFGWKPPDDLLQPISVSEEPVCIHCGLDPVRTKKDGLCRACKRYAKDHDGLLPAEKTIQARKTKRGA